MEQEGTGRNKMKQEGTGRNKMKQEGSFLFYIIVCSNCIMPIKSDMPLLGIGNKLSKKKGLVSS